MEQLKPLDSLNLREKKHYDGVPEDWKLKPVCCLSSVSEEELYYAALEGGSSSGMAEFQKAHSFTLYLFNKKREEVLSFKNHSGIFAHKMEVFDVGEGLLGSVQKHGASKNHFQVKGAGGQLFYDVVESPEEPEIFLIQKGDVFRGKITRRPTRIAEEGVSRNDHFGIIFPLEAEASEKSVLLGALFLIDLSF